MFKDANFSESLKYGEKFTNLAENILRVEFHGAHGFFCRSAKHCLAFGSRSFTMAQTDRKIDSLKKVGFLN